MVLVTLFFHLSKIDSQLEYRSSSFVKDFMTFYFTSDLHIDHYCDSSKDIPQFIQKFLPRADILCVAGDTSDNPKIFIDFYREVSKLYKSVFLVFGNHDLTVQHDDYFLQNPFTETQKKLDWLKEKLAELPNVTLLDGTVATCGKIKIGGTMGFNDFSVGSALYPRTKSELKKEWQYWFDNVNWRYKNNNPDLILQDELGKLSKIIQEKPDIIMTHFIPTAVGIPEKYKNEISNAFFYFDANNFLTSMKHNSLWIAGHTHDFSKKIFSYKKGLFTKKVNLLVNPIGYPMEAKNKYNLKKRCSDFLLNF